MYLDLIQVELKIEFECRSDQSLKSEIVDLHVNENLVKNRANIDKDFALMIWWESRRKTLKGISYVYIWEKT